MDPLEAIESRHGIEGLGALAVQVYTGATREADSPTEAFWATVAALVAMLNQAPQE